MRKIKKNEGDMRKKIMSMIWKSDPWLIVSGVLRSLVQIILPYITIVFSAEVINALTGNYYKRALKIVGWMSASVLVVKCVEAFLESDENRRKISLDLYMKEKLNQICYGVKLEKLESHEFQQNYQQAMDGLDYSALLTRPPLSCFKSIRRSHQSSSVRLACIRHAASVHPEPGSNSLV